MDRSLLKTNARAQLDNSIFSSKWLYGVLVCLITALVSCVVTAPIGFIIALLVGGPIFYGAKRLYLRQARDGGAMNMKEILCGFREDYGGVFLLSLMLAVFILLWSLLLVVPGVIKALSWSMAYYVKNDHPEYDWKQCMQASAQLTEGHKGEIFMLELSFIGWYLVGSLCLGVGTLWVRAYNEATMAQCYEWLRAQQNF